MRDINNYIDNYMNNKFEVNVQVKYRRKMVLKILNEYQPHSILEIGCGLEPIFQFLDLSVVNRIKVIEPGEKFCDNARRLILQYQCHDQVEIVKGFFEEKCRDIKEDYDFILCSGLLHEVEEPSKMLESIRDLCSKDTVVHINVPNAYSLHRILAYEMGIIDDIHQFSNENKVYQQHAVYDIKSLSDLLDLCGFQVIESGSFFCKLFTHQQMQNMIDLAFITDNMLEGFDKLIEYMPQYGSELYINVKKK